MANAAIAGTNKVKGVSISASSQELLMPASNLQTPDIEVRWRSKTNSDFIASGLVIGFDTIVLKGVTASASALIRVRVSSVDVSGAAGDLYDSNIGPAASFDANYDAIVALLPSPVSGYIRIDISDPASARIEAGFLFAAPRHTFSYNYSYGWQIRWEDRSGSQESRGGQDLLWKDNKRRHLTLDFAHITTPERYGVVEQIDRDNGQHENVLIILDVESSNLARDALLGLIEELTPVVQPDAVFNNDGPLYAKQYQLKERL